MREKDAIASKFREIAAGDYVNEQATLGDAVERRGHPRGDDRLHDSRPHGNEQAQARGCRSDRRPYHPGVFARTAGRNQYSVEAETICRLSSLQEIAKAELASSGRGRQITPVAVSRQEPENIHQL